ncbi:MAG: hypothetical protein PVI91_08390 [Gammaproteobacteria bacterium]|jgi:uncharacterized low-complexity protein
MSNKTVMTPLSAALGAAFVTSLAGTSLANAAENPFAMTELSNGYMVAEQAEGKCGEGKTEAEGKCGEGKTEAEGKCGEGKTEAEGKCGGEMKAKEAEGKCGEGKVEKEAEGKCGEGKCGAAK